MALIRELRLRGGTTLSLTGGSSGSGSCPLPLHLEQRVGSRSGDGLEWKDRSPDEIEHS